MNRRAVVAFVAVLALLSSCDKAPPATPAPSASGPESIASVRLSATAGGVVHGPGGAELFVPPGVLSTDGAATITVFNDATVDFHIGVPWTGQVQVRLPVADAATGEGTLIGHQKRDHWDIEDTFFADGHIVAWVNSLSIFKAIGCVFRIIPKDIAKCLVKEGVKTVATSQAKKWAFEQLDACGDILDLNTWLGDGACKAGDPPTPWPTPNKQPAPVKTTAGPPPAPPAPPAPPPAPKAVTHYNCPTDNGNKGIYVAPGHYWRSDPFAAKGSVITGGFVLIGANVDGGNHQARVGIYRSADLSAPLSTTVVNANGYDGENFTLPAALHVTAGETLYLTVVGIGGFTAYDRVDSDCFIGRVDGTT